VWRRIQKKIIEENKELRHALASFDAQTRQLKAANDKLSVRVPELEKILRDLRAEIARLLRERDSDVVAIRVDLNRRKFECNSLRSSNANLLKEIEKYRKLVEAGERQFGIDASASRIHPAKRQRIP